MNFLFMDCSVLVQRIASSNSTLPVVAIFVSFISLFFSYLTSRHNRKTVEPYLIDTYEINSYHAYHLKNCGYGPALIKSLNFNFNGKVYKEIMKLISENAKGISYEIPRSPESSTFFIDDGYIIPAGGEITLFKLYFTNPNLDSALKFQELLAEVGCEIKYQSIYKKKKTLNTPFINRYIPSHKK
jgi:hypothetical protein